LFLRVGHIATSGTDEANIGNIGLLRSFDQFFSDAELLLVSWWDQADGVFQGIIPPDIACAISRSLFKQSSQICLDIVGELLPFDLFKEPVIVGLKA